MYQRSGLGEYPNQSCYDPSRPSWLPYWISSPGELKCVFGEGAAGFYELGQYGRITRPGDVDPPTPTSPADVANSADELKRISQSWDFEQSKADFQDYARRLQERITADENSGAYNPDGNLPLKAFDLSVLAPFLIAGAALFGFQYLKGRA